MIRLGVNIDHIATIRNARAEVFPSVIEAGLIAETNGASLITVHLREDRRHIKDDDVIMLRRCLKTQLNLEMAPTSEMLEFALQIRPDFVCLVPERREELTTEGGLNVLEHLDTLANIISVLQSNDILVSLFVDAAEKQITAASDLGARAIEIHTGNYAELKTNHVISEEFFQIKDMAEYASSIGLIVNAGHGLNYHNVQPIAKIPQMHELNIGFAIIAHSVFWGLPEAVRAMNKLIQEARE